MDAYKALLLIKELETFIKADYIADHETSPLVPPKFQNIETINVFSDPSRIKPEISNNVTRISSRYLEIGYRRNQNRN